MPATPANPPRVRLTRLSTPRTLRDELAEDVRAGLAGQRKSLPPKYFYDQRGSELFEQITLLPEYYLTRAETEILESHAGEIVSGVTPVELVELGSGSSRKTRLLLEAMHRLRDERASSDRRVRYVPLDVSETALRAAAEALTADYPWLEVEGVVGDFHRDLQAVPRRGRRLVAFLGSTIGNLEHDERVLFLKQVAGMLDDEDRFLLGLDLVKDPAVLEAAYNDAAGVTAAFNRNVLEVVNRELGADLPVEAFEHVARYDPQGQCIHLCLRAARDLEVRVPALDLRVTFRAGEELHTEVSCKFTRQRVEDELAEAGLLPERWHADSSGRFALVLAAPQHHSRSE